MSDVRLLTPAEMAELRRLIHEAQTNPYVSQFGQSLAEARATVALYQSTPSLLLAAELLSDIAAAAEEVCESCGEHGVPDLRKTLARYRALRGEE